jgi:hypothetical protein
MMYLILSVKKLRKEQEKSRLAEQERVRQEGERSAELERARLAELERARLAELERVRLAEQERVRQERLRLAEQERVRQERERLAEQERVRLAEQERARFEAFRTLQIQVEQLAERERIRLGSVGNIPPANGSLLPPPGAYIPEDQLVRMTTSHGICPILAGEDEVLYRPSMDCNHFLGAAALSQYLEGSTNSGPFPIRCPSCLANNPTATVGIITESPLHSLVIAGVITDDLQRRILLQHIRLEPDQENYYMLHRKRVHPVR